MNKINMKKDEQIKDIIKALEKTYGPGSARHFLSDEISNYDVLSTGSESLNHALGIGGYPKGRIIEIYGPESSGKTTLSLLAIKAIQDQAKITAFIDTEHAINPKYICDLGINPEKLIISQPDSGEQAFAIMEELIKSSQVDLIILDSVAALLPMAELESPMFDQQMGAQARLMAKGLRKITGLLNKYQTTVIFINQLREKVGVIYGSPEVTPGGRALKFFSSVRIDLRKKETFRDEDDRSGIIVEAKVIKNKLATPFKKVRIKLYFGQGIDQLDELINMALERNVLQKKASWIYFEEQMLAQGHQRLRIKLKQDDELFQKISAKTLALNYNSKKT